MNPKLLIVFVDFLQAKSIPKRVRVDLTKVRAVRPDNYELPEVSCLFSATVSKPLETVRAYEAASIMASRTHADLKVGATANRKTTAANAWDARAAAEPETANHPSFARGAQDGAPEKAKATEKAGPSHRSPAFRRTGSG